MATISKFYLHEAATTNTGTMPSGVLITFSGFEQNAITGDAINRSARSADDVIGIANPDTETTVTAVANQSTQLWGHRRFVSAPLAATTFAAADGNWTFSYARTESNAAHNQGIVCLVYLWRPSAGTRVGTTHVALLGTEGTTSETAESVTAAWSATQAILDGDILVFDVTTVFAQSMSVAYTENFAYDGTTEASTTTCASFVSPPAALTLFGGGATYTKAGHGVEHG